MRRLLLLLLTLTAAAGEAAPGTAPPDRRYRLAAGDLVELSVFDHADLALSVRVPAAGGIAVPLIGDVAAVIGRTPEEVAAEIAKRLEKDYLKQAIVTLTVREFAVRRAHVMGAVAEPKALRLEPTADTTALQAIVEAGGFGEDANRAGTVVVRSDPAAPGGRIALPVPDRDTPEALAKDVRLQPDDLIVVPRLDRIYIIGEVTRPGAVNLPAQGGLTVSKAVSLAGGFGRYAKQTTVLLVRAGAAVREVDVRAVLSGDRKAEDPALQPGDTVYVPESRF